MRKIILNSIFAFIVFLVLSYLFWLGTIKTRPEKSAISLQVACELLSKKECHESGLSFWLKVNSECPFSRSIIRELTLLSFRGNITMVTSEPSSNFVEETFQKVLGNEVDIYYNVSSKMVDSLFESPFVPVLMLFENGKLSQRHVGYVALDQWLQDR